MNRLLLSVILILACVPALSRGATVTYTLEIDSTGPGSWALYAQSSSLDNAGISLWAVTLLNVDPVVSIRAPYLEYSLAGFKQIGLHNLETTDPLFPSGIGSSQNVVGGMPVVYGLGQIDGLLTVPVGGTWLGSRSGLDEPQIYSAKLLLATGTYASGTPAFDLEHDQSANVFEFIGDTTPVPATVAFTTVPEPAIGGVALLSILSLAYRRNRAMPA